MRLLIFAHKGEAQTFIKQSFFKPIKDCGAQVYENEEDLLLICGEGIQSATETTSFILGKYLNSIDEVINLGVCGALNENNKPGEIHLIRSTYLESFDEIQFKSFTYNEGTLDLITSSKRVLNDDYASMLENFAPLVDREYWAIASAAKTFSKRSIAIKLISDNARGSEICKVVRDSAEDYSDQLYQYFCENFKTNREEFNRPELELPNLDIHFSVSMKRKLQSLLDSLNVKYNYSPSECFNKIKIEEISDLDIHPKNKAHLVLEKLSLLLNPYKFEVSMRIQDYFKTIEKYGLKLSADKQLDKEDIQVNFSVKNDEELQIILHSLKKLEVSKFQQILRGEDHV